jgi:hypothetical protein
VARSRTRVFTAHIVFKNVSGFCSNEVVIEEFARWITGHGVSGIQYPRLLRHPTLVEAAQVNQYANSRMLMTR